jgi:hypothetical protein
LSIVVWRDASRQETKEWCTNNRLIAMMEHSSDERPPIAPCTSISLSTSTFVIQVDVDVQVDDHVTANGELHDHAPATRWIGRVINRFCGS